MVYFLSIDLLKIKNIFRVLTGAIVKLGVPEKSPGVDSAAIPTVNHWANRDALFIII